MTDIVVQSNAPLPEETAANGDMRINSGFYRVRSSSATISAFAAIVNHAMTSGKTEQPSFYIILCGGKSGETKIGADHCQYQSNASQVSIDVFFLNRLHYPNGAVNHIWDSITSISQAHPEVIVLHNNWISGLKKKIQRQIIHQLWWFEHQNQVCDYSAVAPVMKFDWDV